ncbi:hypothetical protein ACFT7S_17405 [Streptomyces sp. NPDC057136]|uniref:hypothetical protein n=1 Tax=Streptomyces sp. NPDC057136 TaxID=3346029 RepID=UPI00364465F1
MWPTYANENAKVLDRANHVCALVARRRPNFIADDQYKDGDPMAAVRSLNQNR